MKNSIRVLLAFVIMTSILISLAACKGNVDESTTSSQVQSSDVETEIPTIHLKYLTHGIPNLVDEPKYGEEVLAAVNEKLAQDLGFMITTEYISYADDVYQEKVSLDLAGGQEYDMIRLPVAAAADLFNKGMLMDLTDVINSSAPNFKANVPDNLWAECSAGGKIYALPSTGFNVIFGAWIRGEWLDKTGLGMPTTLSQFEAVMKKFRDEDYNETGRNDIIPYAVQYDNAESVLLGLFTETPGDYVDGSGNIMPKYFDPGYKQFVGLLRNWYGEIYVDDQLFMGDDNSISDLYSQNRVAIAGLNVWHLEWGPINAVDKNRPEVQTKFMKQFDSEMKGYQSGGMVSSMLGASSNSENYEYAVKFVDWYYFNEDNYYLAQKGIQGKTYDIVDNALTIPEGETATTQLELIGLIAPQTSVPMEFKYYPATTPVESKNAYDYAVKEVELSKVYVPVTKFVTPVIPDDLKIKHDEALQLLKEDISNIVKGKLSLDDFDKALQDFKDNGGLEYYEFLTEEYKK